MVFGPSDTNYTTYARTLFMLFVHISQDMLQALQARGTDFRPLQKPSTLPEIEPTLYIVIA